jgi:hypothetical protein
MINEPWNATWSFVRVYGKFIKRLTNVARKRFCMLRAVPGDESFEGMQCLRDP